MIGSIEKLKRGFRGVLDNVEAKNIEKKRTRYLEQLRARNNNHSFTLISNNCVGGVISHNLGEQFRSPTVNLFISGDQFLPFVKGVRLYLSDETELIQVKDNTRNYPVGRLHPANDTLEDIFIYFQHYKSFEDAKKKWTERTRRVNWDNVFLYLGVL